MTSNPFRPTRFEHHNQPLLWLSATAKELERESSFYVSGTRGSGKTSLLKTLNWRERAENETLRAQIDKTSPFISVYFRIPDHISFSLAKIDWRHFLSDSPDPDAVSFTYFSLMIEAISGSLLLNALEASRANKLFQYSAADAEHMISELFDKYPQLKLFSNENDHYRLMGLARALDNMQRRMNTAATRGLIGQIINQLPECEPGLLIQDLTESIQKLLSKSNELHFKICIDDCEALRKDQQTFLNSLVRKSKKPLYWIISYVGHDYESTSGLYPSHNLTDADRKVIELDSTMEADFIKLCESVSSLRIYYSLTKTQRAKFTKGSINSIFRSSDILGNMTINDLILFGMKHAVSKDISEIKKLAHDISVHLQEIDEGHAPAKISPIRVKDKSLPIYETFVLKELHPGRELEFVQKHDERSAKSFSAYIRRKQRSALIAICSRYKIQNIPYAGRNVVYGISDGCIRDFLEIMAEIYESYSSEKDKAYRFATVRSHLKIDVQRKGILKASNSKFSGIKENADSHVAELTKLVECLGNLTALIHRDIRTAEKGVFVLDYDELRSARTLGNDSPIDIVLRVISRGEADGILRSESPRIESNPEGTSLQTQITFRLHRRFAPRYGFSFRGPYEPISLPVDKVFQVCSDPDSINPKEWARDVRKQLKMPAENQPRLDL